MVTLPENKSFKEHKTKLFFFSWKKKKEVVIKGQAK
jgi:hypothetical protein